MKFPNSPLTLIKLNSRAMRLSFIAIGSSLILSACTTYQAPVSERGTVVERTPPLVLSTTGASTSTSGSRPATTSTSSSSAGSRTAATSGAATVAVTPTRSGIDRSTISRTPVANTSAGSSAASTATSTTSPSSAASTASGSSLSALPQASAQVLSQAPSAASDSTTGSSATAHVVTRGETLYSIAFLYDLDFRRLALANNLQPPYTIYPDQRLSLNQAGISETAVSSLPTIPASPAGESVAPQGQRPQIASENRRREDMPTRQVDGVAWQWPVQGRLLRNFASSSGDITGRGIDIVGRRGDPVYAAADGDVVYAGRGIQGAGDLIIIRHGSRLLSAYMYNSAMLVSEGARINAGDKIAEVGSDIAGQELLHFEVRLDGKPVDPLLYLPAR